MAEETTSKFVQKNTDTAFEVNRRYEIYLIRKLSTVN